MRKTSSAAHRTFEFLEERRVLATMITELHPRGETLTNVSAVDGSVVIEATDHFDTVNVFPTFDARTGRTLVRIDNNIREEVDFFGNKTLKQLKSEFFLIDNGVGGALPRVVFLGKGGDDNFSVDYRAAQHVYAHGGADNDQLSGTHGADILVGGPGDDTISGSLGNDLLIGNEDDDHLNGDRGNDILLGGDGFDTLNGGLDNDVLDGGGVSILARLQGRTLFDKIFGSDHLIGGQGADLFVTTTSATGALIELPSDANRSDVRYSEGDVTTHQSAANAVDAAMREFQADNGSAVFSRVLRDSRWNGVINHLHWNFSDLNWPGSVLGPVDWISDRLPGDSNGDGIFDSSDLIAGFQHGKYEDGIANNANFVQGDWNQDGDFDTGDMLLAFQSGQYVGG